MERDATGSGLKDDASPFVARAGWHKSLEHLHFRRATRQANMKPSTCSKVEELVIDGRSDDDSELISV